MHTPSIVKNTIENLHKSSSEEGDVIKEIIVDFLYQFKDKHPFSNPSREGPMDVFNDIMEFLYENELEPSQKLKEYYINSELNKMLNEFPNLDQLENEYKVEVDKEVFNELEKLFNTKPKFEFYFNPDITITTNIDTEDRRLIRTGFFNKENETSIGAGIFITKYGEIYQGYFKDDKKHIFGRAFSWDGECYTGCYKQDHGRHGKGEIEHSNKEKERGVFDNGWKQGDFELFDQEGNKSTKKYRDNKEVEDESWWSKLTKSF